MKKHKFKLEAVLKMRKLEEEQCKLRIGRLQSKKTELLAEIENENAGIDEAYRSQEESIKQGASGLDLRFYPYFMEGKRAATRQIQDKLSQLDELIAQCFEELRVLRGKTKVLEQMKEKDKKAHKKKYEKEMNLKIEEQVLNWSQSQLIHQRLKTDKNN